MPGTWDKRIDFDSTKSRIAEAIVKARDECSRTDGGEDVNGNQVGYPLAPIYLLHYTTMMIQLRNATRASEAWDAVLLWAKAGNRQPEVRVRKRAPQCASCHHIKTGGKGSKVTGHEVLPRDADGKSVRGKCQVTECVVCSGYSPDPNDVEMRTAYIPPECLDVDRALIAPVLARGITIEAYESFCKRHLVNSHSFRFCGITEMHRKGVPMETIAQVTHHKNPMQVYNYLQTRDAEIAQKALAGVEEKKET